MSASRSRKPDTHCSVKGVVAEEGEGGVLFGCRVRHPHSRLGQLSGIDGVFDLQLPHSCLRKRSRLWILSANHYPRRISLPALTGAGFNLGHVPLRLWPFESFGGMAVLSLLNWLLMRTRLERFLLIAVGFLLAPLALVAFVSGLALSGNTLAKLEADNPSSVNNRLLHAGLDPKFVPELIFFELPSRFFPGGRYRLRGGTYTVGSDLIIPRGAVVHIDAGSVMEFDSTAGVVVQGQLVVAGSARSPVLFRARDSRAGWRGIYLEGEPRLGAVASIDADGMHVHDARGTLCRMSEGYIPMPADRDGAGEAVFTAGGAIFAKDANVVLRSSRFDRCQAAFGGAIYARNTVVSPVISTGAQGVRSERVPPAVRIETSVFADCGTSSVALDLARNDVVVGGGGAIFVQNTALTCVGTSFLEAKARGYATCGGAVFLGAGSSGRFENCFFSYNHADAEGGAIYAFHTRNLDKHATAGLVVMGCVFERNRAAGSGGAITASNSRFKISDSKFVENRVVWRGKSPVSKGGGLCATFNGDYQEGHPSMLENVLFENNRIEEGVGLMENEGAGFFIYAVKRAEPFLALHLSKIVCDGNTGGGHQVLLPHVAALKGATAEMVSRYTGNIDDKLYFPRRSPLLTKEVLRLGVDAQM